MPPIKRNILLTPGPATTTDTVKMAMVVSDICPRETEFCELVAEIRSDLVKIAKGDHTYTAVLFSGSGTAVMDATINSVVPPKRKIAIISNGAYGERMVKIAQAYQLDYTDIRFGYGEKINLAEVEVTLINDSEISCLAMVHHETTTGILNPIKKIGEIAKKHRRIFIVDAISSFAGVPINIQECNIDFMMSTSNKCIQGMSGVALVICKISELEKVKNYPPRSFYLNLYNQYKFFEETGQSQFTPPVQIIYALKQAIREYFAEGGDNRYRRYTANWRFLRSGLLELGFSLLHDEEEESHILLTVIEPEDPRYSFRAMHDFLYERGVTIYPGKVGHRNTFRLANIGDISTGDIRDFLVLVKKYLHVL